MNKKVTDKNYDLIFKLTAGVFKGRILDFLGIKSAQIGSNFVTELPLIEANTRHTDFMYKLVDGTLLHLEFQSNFSKDTLFGIFMYDARIVRKYKMPVKTVIVYSGNDVTLENSFDMEAIKYEAEIIYIKRDYDAEEIYIKELEKIKLGKTPDWLNLIFLPIMKSSRKEAERAKDVIGIFKRINLKKSHFEALVAATMVLADKFFKEKELNELWEEISMLNVIKFAEKKGMEKGVEEGIEKGIEEGKIKTAKNMLEEDMDIKLIEKITGLSAEMIEKLKQ